MIRECWIGKVVKGAVVVDFKVLSRNLTGGTDENNEKFESEQPVSWPRFEPGASRIRSREVNHSTTTFGLLFIKRVSLLTHFTHRSAIACVQPGWATLKTRHDGLQRILSLCSIAGQFYFMTSDRDVIFSEHVQTSVSGCCVSTSFCSRPVGGRAGWGKLRVERATTLEKRVSLYYRENPHSHEMLQVLDIACLE
jgi:hypothetical protein